MPEFKVGILSFCFNHSRFLKKTLDGFSSQKTDFKYVAVVIDDASTDGSQEVIEGYLNEHFTDSEDIPQVRQETADANILFLNHKKNKNFYIVVILLKYNYFQLKKSKGQIISEWVDGAKYWAYCECDDYWIDENKLQEQVDFLDNNSDYGFLYTDFDIKNYDNGEYIQGAFRNGIKPVINSFEQHLVSRAYIAPMTWMARIPFSEIMNSYHGPDSIDLTFIIALELFSRTKVHYIDKVTSVYTRHLGSATKQPSLAKRYDYDHGVYATQKYYLDKYNLRENHPTCLDYFLNAYYCYIITEKKADDYQEVLAFFKRKKDVSLKFNIFERLMGKSYLFPILRIICKIRLLRQR